MLADTLDMAVFTAWIKVVDQNSQVDAPVIAQGLGMHSGADFLKNNSTTINNGLRYILKNSQQQILLQISNSKDDPPLQPQ